MSADYLEPRWYVAQTFARHEKRVTEHLDRRSVQSFLPLYRRISRWKDRRVQLQLPLFAGYVFVRIPLKDRLKVLEIPSVARLVGFNGRPAALAEDEIEALRNGLAKQVAVQPYRFLTVGRHVRIRSGPLAGLNGILLRRKGQCRVVVSVQLIARSFVAEVETADIERPDNR